MSRVDVAAWARRTADLEQAKIIVDGPALTIPGDPDQLDQLLINLVHNAVEANAETSGQTVRISWSLTGATMMLVVEDEGPGVADTSNLFVPFFTTKPQGSGIGLVLARQIAEAHGGSLVLRNRKTGRGAEAIITLPAPKMRTAAEAADARTVA
jgi:signal transduction histidine kinase